MRHSPKPGDYAILSASAQHSIVKEIQRLRKQKQLPKLSAGNQGTRAIMQEPRGPTAQAPFFVARKRATDYTQKAIKPVKQALIHTLNLGPWTLVLRWAHRSLRHLTGDIKRLVHTKV